MIAERAKEIATFLGMSYDDALRKLSQGFIPLHHAVTEEFRKANPQGDEALLNWYRSTESYIWELSAYHEDAGYNYAGTVNGILTRLQNDGIKSVLCLGDGVGDVTIEACARGMDPSYHDLYGSRTKAFARFRMLQRDMRPLFDSTHDFDAVVGGFGSEPEFYESVVSLDFLEHVPNVEEWVKAVHIALIPGGLFFAQNAFACGSGADGSIPMHLACNDRFEKDWDPMLKEVGFDQLSSNWYRKI